ncbi:hypothetical protein ACIUY2_30370, partial [Pseudomonas aeruginosa]
ATPLLAEHFDAFVFAGSHKHSRLPIPYGKGETVSCVSRGSFIMFQRFLAFSMQARRISAAAGAA